MESSSTSVGIIVLNWNGKEDTNACIDSLLKCSYPNKEIVIVDNGSTDGSQDHFRTAFPTCTLLETKENLGYAGGNNVGINYGLEKGFEFFLILNNDTIVDPGLLEAFLRTFEEVEEAGILGGKIYRMDERDRFDHFGGVWNRKKISFDYVGYRILDDGMSWETPIEIDYVCGASIMIRRKVIEAIGTFDERFFLFCEETDFCFRARKVGFSVMTCPKAKLWHKGSASFIGQKAHPAYFCWRNRLLWIERNFSGFERFFYLAMLLGFYLPFLYQLRALRSIQLVLQKLFYPNKKLLRNKERIKRYNAAIYGMTDYVARRFGPGRSHLFH